MLPQTTLVKVRKAIEKTYVHFCNVIVKEEYTKKNHSTGLQEKIIIENQPCRISFLTIKDTEENLKAANVLQTIKLFIAPEINIPPGSKIIVNHDGIESSYSKSGDPATYPTHQEITLVLWKDWA